MRKLPFKRLDKYRIDSVLGVGGMGAVYRGYDEDIDRVVAVKVIHPHLRVGAAGAELEQRFRHEAKAAARCMHPNIVTVFDYGLCGDMPYLVMEFVKGVELKALLGSESRFSLAQSVDIGLQLLLALGFAHENGVIHRDIKPANVMLLESGVVKLSDFGVAHLENSDITTIGHALGTPNYMSPEGRNGLPVDARGDLFTLGVMLLELVAGQRLNANLIDPSSVRQHLLSVAQDDPALLALESLLQKALHVDPDSRYQTAAEFSIALKHLENAQPLEATASLAHTVINSPAFQHKDKGLAAQQPSSGRQVDQPSVWQPNVLNGVESELAKFLGPLAKVIVRRHASDCSSFDELSHALADHIQQRGERHQFLQNLDASGISSAIAISGGGRSQSVGQVSQGHSLMFEQPIAPQSVSASVSASASAFEAVAVSSAASRSRSVAAAGSGFDGLDYDQLAARFSEYMGPLAKRLVRAEMRKADDTEQLVQRLAAKIPNKREQQEFLKSLSR